VRQKQRYREKEARKRAMWWRKNVRRPALQSQTREKRAGEISKGVDEKVSKFPSFPPKVSKFPSCFKIPEFSSCEFDPFCP
jgi:hypothetical protein